jgi:cysteine desulfurase / selenocysteine lyase
METKNHQIEILKARDDFPILKQRVNGKPLIYFDNAATTQKPKVVIDFVHQLYSEMNSNVHRGCIV